MDNDGHDTSLAFAANWTLSFLTPLLANTKFMENTLILLTYDESETYAIPNRISSILLGGAVPQSLKGTNDSTMYTHYSILSTLENNWNLPNLGRYDVGANVFDLVAKKTGYKNIIPEDSASVNNSLSYAGFLNDNTQNYLPIPAPNLQLIGAGGQGVVEAVRASWIFAASENTPYDGSSKLFDGGNGKTNLNAPLYKPQAPASIVAADTAPSPTMISGATRTVRLGLTWAGVGFGALTLAAFLL